MLSGNLPCITDCDFHAAVGPSAALILNATKHLAGIDHSVLLIPQEMIEPIKKNQYTH